MTILFPDPLSWQAGTEYGLMALAELQKAGVAFRCFLPDRGPQLEAVGFAAHQLDLTARARFVRNVVRHRRAPCVVLLPRVYPLDRDVIRQSIEQGCTVISSDPGLDAGPAGVIRFPRRDWGALAAVLLEAAGRSAGAAQIASPPAT